MEHPVSPKEKLYTISEAAEFLGISVPTIRLYEREGLIIASRSESGHRVFSAADIERIRCLRSAINNDKISIKGIRRLLALVPCWRIKNCPEEARQRCAAFTQHDSPCWHVTEKSWECKATDCKLCLVYTHYSDCHNVKDIVTQYTVSPLQMIR